MNLNEKFDQLVENHKSDKEVYVLSIGNLWESPSSEAVFDDFYNALSIMNEDGRVSLEDVRDQHHGHWSGDNHKFWATVRTELLITKQSSMD